jgi:hypothetical protein
MSTELIRYTILWDLIDEPIEHEDWADDEDPA